MKYIYALVMAFLCGATHAGTATLSWPLVAVHTDGTPTTGVVTYTAYKGLKGQAKTLLISGLTGTSYLDTALPAGTWCYDMVAVEAGNPTPSDHGTEGCKTIPLAPPNSPPITVASAVYQPKPALNGYTLIAVGTVKLGVPCDPDQDVNGLCVVNRSQVKWTGAARPNVVVAVCG